MKFEAIFALPILLLVACVSQTADPKQESLMNEVEAQVVLPDGAGPLSSYARYYTIARDGMLVGTYTREIEERDPDEGCTELLEDFELKEVDCPALADVAIGERRWVDIDDLPAASADGCEAVQVVYDPKAQRFVFGECIHPLH
ncbi:MAG: hypothetical protein ACN4E0_04915 [Qipengyuania sp.]